MMKCPAVRRGAWRLPIAGSWPMVGDCSTIKAGSGFKVQGSKFKVTRNSEPLSGLFLSRLPDLQNPLLRFFLARREFGVGIGESIFDTWDAALLRQHLAEGDVIAQ